jgi:hypothetical protein
MTPLFKGVIAVLTFFIASVFLFIAWLNLAIANTFGGGHLLFAALLLIAVLLIVRGVKIIRTI